MVFGERRGAGLGVSKAKPKGKGGPEELKLLNSNSSLLLLMLESFRSHEASEGERGGAEANTSPVGEMLGCEAGLKAEVSPSSIPCTEESWREAVLSNIPLSTMSLLGSSFSGEKGGDDAWTLLPRLAFSVSIRRSNGSSGCGAKGKEPSPEVVPVEGMVNGAAVAFSSLFRTIGLTGAIVGQNKSSDRGGGSRPSSGQMSCFQGLLSMSAKEASGFA